MGIFSTSRKSDKDSILVTPSILRREGAIVQGEYEKLGLWSEKLDDVEVYLILWHRAYGYYTENRAKYIAIPSLSRSRIIYLMYGRDNGSVRDVLRHEYAHALADTHRALIGSRRYREHFGTTYKDEREQLYDKEFHVSDYAASKSAEDFAETVMWYVKGKGIIPKRWVGTAIHAKYEFIRELAEAITDGRSRW